MTSDTADVSALLGTWGTQVSGPPGSLAAPPSPSTDFRDLPEPTARPQILRCPRPVLGFPASHTYPPTPGSIQGAGLTGPRAHAAARMASLSSGRRHSSADLTSSYRVFHKPVGPRHGKSQGLTRSPSPAPRILHPLCPLRQILHSSTLSAHTPSATQWEVHLVPSSRAARGSAVTTLSTATLATPPTISCPGFAGSPSLASLLPLTVCARRAASGSLEQARKRA